MDRNEFVLFDKAVKALEAIAKSMRDRLIIENHKELLREATAEINMLTSLADLTKDARILARLQRRVFQFLSLKIEGNELVDVPQTAPATVK